MSQRLLILPGLLCFGWASFALAGDTFEAQHVVTLAANPPDVHLKISLDSAQTAFRIGDTIRLKYEFTADSPGKYVAGARFLDHGQRSVLESFFTDHPAEARGPLHDYWDFHRAIDGNISTPRASIQPGGNICTRGAGVGAAWFRNARPGGATGGLSQGPNPLKHSV